MGSPKIWNTSISRTANRRVNRIYSSYRVEGLWNPESYKVSLLGVCRVRVVEVSLESFGALYIFQMLKSFQTLILSFELMLLFLMIWRKIMKKLWCFLKIFLTHDCGFRKAILPSVLN